MEDFYYTSTDHETLVLRPMSHYDGFVPSGTSSAVFALLRLARIFDRKDYEQTAEIILFRFAPLMAKAPDQFANLLCTLNFHLDERVELVIVADQDIEAEKLVFAAGELYLPNKVMVAGLPERKDGGCLLIERRWMAKQPHTFAETSLAKRL